MKYIILLLFIFTIGVSQEKKKVVTQPAQKIDSTSLWLKKEEAVRYLSNQRQAILDRYLPMEVQAEVFRIEGQMQFLEAIAQDSVKIKK